MTELIGEINGVNEELQKRGAGSQVVPESSETSAVVFTWKKHVSTSVSGMN